MNGLFETNVQITNDLEITSEICYRRTRTGEHVRANQRVRPNQRTGEHVRANQRVRPYQHIGEHVGSPLLSIPNQHPIGLYRAVFCDNRQQVHAVGSGRS